MTQLIVALDFDDLNTALNVVDDIGEDVVWYKVGKQLFTLYGPQVLKELKARGKKVFLDLKFHDIPNTVAKAVESAISIGADMVNFHASGGSAMIARAVEENKKDGVYLIAVTVLTSMDEDAVKEIGYPGDAAETVVRFAGIAEKGGADGVVCSAWEIEPLKKKFGKDFVVVVPGIRPAGSATDDQKRIMTPAQAAELGADFIVVGRPITKAEDRTAAAKSVLSELS